MFDDSLLNILIDYLKRLRGKFGIILYKGLKWTKNIFMLIYNVVLNKILIFLYYLAHKGLNRFKEIMTSYRNITKASIHNFS